MIEIVKRYVRESDHAVYQHVAIIVRHGKIVRIAANKGWRHAEERAILGTPHRLLVGSTIYSYRLSRAGALRLAKPCTRRPDGRPSCAELIRLAGIRCVVYSADGQMIEEEVDAA